MSSFRTLSKYRCANKKLEEVQRLRDRYVAVLEELHDRALFYAAENDRLSREAAEAAERTAAERAALEAAHRAKLEEVSTQLLPSAMDFVHITQALSKELWRKGFMQCPEYCAMDTPSSECACTCERVFSAVTEAAAAQQGGTTGE